MKAMKYSFYSDPSHGWLKVPAEEINQLAISKEISPCSYITADGKYAYLDRDKDAHIFLKAVLTADWFEDIKAIRKCTRRFRFNSSSSIYNLDSFSSHQCSSLSPFQKSIQF